MLFDADGSLRELNQQQQTPGKSGINPAMLQQAGLTESELMDIMSAKGMNTRN